MNKRFKFRVWFKHDKFMLKDILGFAHQINITHQLTGYIRVFSQSNGELIYPEENIELMQCTGVTDEDGNQIFEGDIIKYDNINKYFKVVYESGTFLLVHLDGTSDIEYDKINSHNAFVDEDWSGCQLDNCVSFLELIWNQNDLDSSIDAKVIGNIYENPELLKKGGE